MAETTKEPDKIKQYMASLEANLEKATGKSLAQWIKVAKTCPPGKPREQLKWFKDKHGLGQARAGLILARAFGGTTFGDDDSGAPVDKLFAKSFVGQRPLYEKVAAFAAKLGKGTISPRRGYVAFYRLKQYAAVKPSKNGLLVGLALRAYPKSKKLVDVKNLGGGERIRKAMLLAAAKDFDEEAPAPSLRRELT